MSGRVDLLSSGAAPSWQPLLLVVWFTLDRLFCQCLAERTLCIQAPYITKQGMRYGFTTHDDCVAYEGCDCFC